MRSLYRKFDNVLLYIIILELVFGGLGHLFGIKIRNILFVIAFLYTLFIILKRGIQIKKRTVIYIIIIIGYSIYGSIIGLLNGNSIKDIIADANVFVSILYVIIYLVLIDKDKIRLNKLINSFIVFCDLLAIIVYGVFQWSNYALLNGINAVDILVKFQKVTQYGLITGFLYSNAYARVYVASGIFFQLVLAICLIRLAYRENFKIINFESLSILFLLMGIIATGTRGYWLGTLIVIVLVPFFIWKTKKTSLFIYTVTIVIVLLLSFVVPNKIISMNAFGTDKNQTGIFASIYDRVGTTADFTEGEISNNIRSVQLECMLEKVKENPVFGSGFGTRIPKYEELTNRDSLNFELYYIELWYKTGSFGILMLLIGVIYLLVNSYKISSQVNQKESNVIKGWTIGFFSVCGSSATNPYLAGLFGFFTLIFLIVITDIYDDFSENINIKLGE